jgi:hypothetical protein
MLHFFVSICFLMRHLRVARYFDCDYFI